MNPALIVPTVQAALDVAQFIQSSYSLYRAGHMTEQQLQTAWAQVGVTVQAANAAWDAAGRAQQPQPAPAATAS